MKADFSELGNEFKSDDSNSSNNSKRNIAGAKGTTTTESLLRNKYYPQTDLSNRNLVSLGSISNPTQQKLLLRYIKEKDLAGMKNCIGAGANPNYGENETTVNEPLYLAAYSGFESGLQYLLSTVADKNAVGRDYNKSLLYYMCSSSEAGKCKKCVESYKLDVNKAHPHMFQFILNGHYSRSLGNNAMYLLNKGLDIKYYDDFNLAGTHPKIIEELGKLQSFRNKVESYGKDFTQRCDDKNGLESSKAFINAGMNPSAKCSNCLYQAIYKNNTELVKFLITNGINVNPQNSCKTGYSKSPLQKAIDDNKSMDIINALMSAGAK